MKRFLLLFPVLAFGQVAPEATFNVQLQNLVFYMDQIGDATKYATVPSITPLDPSLGSAFRRYVIMADVVSVDGKASNGTFFAHGISLATSNSSNPAPGHPIADLPRNQMHEFVLDIMTPDKVQVGSLYGYWLGAGASAPGAPPGAGVLAVVGGTGAYVGVHGQGSNVGSANLRVASMTEDPAYRRVNGGGQLTLGINLTGTNLAQVIAVYHASDFSPVTSSNAARSGEVVTLQVKAGWPVNPPLKPGTAFSGPSYQAIATPVEALVNNVPAEVLSTNNIGWPGTRDQYRVDVRLPGGLAHGTATLQLDGAYLPGVPFDIPVQ